MTRRSTLLPRFLGFSVQGDLGPFTFYTNRKRKIVWYDRAPPLTPPTYAQSAVRNRMACAALAWSALPTDQQANWRRVCRRLRLECVGFGLWFYWWQKRDVATLATLEMQSGIVLLTPEAKNV